MYEHKIRKNSSNKFQKQLITVGSSVSPAQDVEIEIRRKDGSIFSLMSKEKNQSHHLILKG
ncbi:MAG: hypothetical protein QM504_03955 [Pseudomonadota bacterium]